MSEFKNLTLEVADGIAVLAISRPAALNALNSETLDELNVCLSEIEANDDIKAVILTGGPDKKGNEFKSFVAGADIAEMVNFTAPEARAFGIKASEPFFKLMNMRQVTIAAVNGFALGGGCEISMACDIRIASENAIFGQPECGLGIIPGFGGTQRLARLVGMGRAKEMIFTCDNVDANEAYRIGLVNKVVAKEELMPTAKAMAAKIISKGSYAVSVAKAAINNGYDMDIKNAVEMEANLFGCGSGKRAFIESRMVIELMENCIDAGFEEKTAIDFINTAYINCSGKDSPVTMDMSVVDCQSGMMHCIKLGAVSTFIKREGWVEIIKSSTLPIGVLEKVDYDCTAKKLYDGDYVIMVSDGVLDNLPCLNKEEKMVEIIEEVVMKKPKAIADEILRKSMSYNNCEVCDDCTVLVFGLFDTYNK